MSSVNKVILVGRLGQDPVTRHSAQGEAMCHLSVATSSQWNDKATGERRQETEWHRVVFYRRLAEIADQYLRKGQKIYVEGRLKTRKWQDKQTGADHYSTEVIGDQLQMLGSKDSSEETQAKKNSDEFSSRPPPLSSPSQAAQKQPGLADLDDDIPF